MIHVLLFYWRALSPLANTKVCSTSQGWLSFSGDDRRPAEAWGLVTSRRVHSIDCPKVNFFFVPPARQLRLFRQQLKWFTWPTVSAVVVEERKESLLKKSFEGFGHLFFPPLVSVYKFFPPFVSLPNALLSVAVAKWTGQKGKCAHRKLYCESSAKLYFWKKLIWTFLASQYCCRDFANRRSRKEQEEEEGTYNRQLSIFPKGRWW